MNLTGLKKNIPVPSDNLLKASPYQPESVRSHLPSAVTISESTPSTSDGLEDKFAAPLEAAKKQQELSWVDTPEFVGQEIKKNQITNIKLQEQKSLAAIADQAKKAVETSPAFSATNPNAELNKQAYLKKLGEKGYDQAEIAKIAGIDYKPNFLESISNSVENIGTSIEGTIPNMKLVTADVMLDWLPLANTNPEMYGSDFVDTMHKWRGEAYSEKKALEQETLPTRGIVESFKSKDVAGFVASVVDASTALISTAATAIPTMGTSLVTDMSAQAMYDFNQAKAEEMGVSVDELYETGQNEVVLPLSIGVLGAALEGVGLKGIGKAISAKIKNGGAKQLVNIMVASNKEGLTEWTQQGLEDFNKEIAKGVSAEEASVKALDSMLSEKGLEAYLGGAFGAAGATVAGRLLVQKSEVETEINKANTEGRTQDAEMFTKKAQDIDAALQELATRTSEMDANLAHAEVALEDSKKELERLSAEREKESVTETGKLIIDEKINALNSFIQANPIEDEKTTPIPTDPVQEEETEPIKGETETQVVSEEKPNEENNNLILKTEENGKPTEDALPKRLSQEEKQGILRSGEIGAGAAILVDGVQGTSQEIKRSGKILLEDATPTVVKKDLTEEAKANQGRTAMEVAQEKGDAPTEAEMDKYVAQNSENVFEIAETYVKAVNTTEDKQGTLLQEIKDQGIKITEKAWGEFGDINNLTKAIRDKYISEDASPLDTKAEELGVTTQDIIETIVNEDLKRFEPKSTPLIVELKQRYKELTGKNLTTKEAKRLSDKGVKGAIADYEKYLEGLDTENQLSEKTEKQRSLADSVRKLKIDLSKMSDGGMQMNILGIPVAIYNTVVETVALSIDAGATLAQAIDKAIIEHKLNSHKDFDRNGLIAKLEGAVGQHVVGVHKKEQERLKEKYGIESETDYEKIKLDDLNSQAEKILQETPERVEALMEKDMGMKEDGTYKNPVSPLDVAILRQYVSSLVAKIETSATPELIAELNRALNKAKEIGVRFGQDLSSMKGLVLVQDSLGDWLVQRQNNLGLENLSDAEIAEVKQLHKAHEEANQEIKATYKDLEGKTYKSPAKEEFERILKENEELKKQIAEYRKSQDKTKHTASQKKKADAFRERWKTKKQALSFKDKDGNEIFVDDVTANGLTKNDFVEIIAKAIETSGVVADKVSNVIQQVKDTDWYKKLDGGDRENFKKMVEGAINEEENAKYNELIEKVKASVASEGMTPEGARNIKAAVRELVRKGEKDLHTIAKKISGDSGDRVPSEEIIAVIGGKYTERKTKTELQGVAERLRTYATLIEKYNKLLNGETPEKAANTRKVEDRKEIEAVKAEINKLEKDLGIKDQEALERRAKNALKSAKEFEDKIAKGDFSKKEKKNLLSDPTVTTAHPKEVKKLRDALRKRTEAKIDFLVALNEDTLKNRNLAQKGVGTAKKIINTVSKMKATWDASVMGVHAYYVLFTNPKLWGTGFAKGAKAALSKERFDDYVNELKEDKDRYDEYTDVGLEILDYHKIKEGEAEGILRKTFFDEHKIGGKKINVGKYVGTEMSDRAFIAMGNLVRIALYDLHTAELKKKGMTYLTHPKEFESVARYVNNLTGRAKAGKMFQNDLVNFFIWSPAKLSARLNAIGMGDAFSYATGSKGYYREMTPHVQKIAAKNAIKVLGIGMATMLAAGLAGADVDTDDESPTFGWITFPGGMQWNVFGEEASLARAIVNIMRGEITKSGTSVGRFIRGKLSPVPASATDLMTGKTFMGESVYDVNDEIKSDWAAEQIAPMSVKNIVEEWNRDPLVGAIMTPFLFSGLPVYSEKAYAEMKARMAEDKYNKANEIGMTEETISRIQQEKDEELDKADKKEIRDYQLQSRHPELNITP